MEGLLLVHFCRLLCRRRWLLIRSFAQVIKPARMDDHRVVGPFVTRCTIVSRMK